MREIGSEFWDVPTGIKENNVFPKSTQWYLAGCCALQAIIRELDTVRSIAMPSWCCDSMVKPFADAGISVQFYPVYFDGSLVQEIDRSCDALFMMDYFGYTSPAPKLADYNGIIIRDVTHSVFSNAYSDADYYIGSLRKWCGVWTGGYAWSADGHPLLMEENDDHGYTVLREKAMKQKSKYLHELQNGKAGEPADKSYLAVYTEAEELLENIEIAPAAPRDIEAARYLDTVTLKSRRRQNAHILMDAFRDWLIFPTLRDDECPLCVPVLVPGGKRDALRRYLIRRDIYCPIHWPVSKYHRLDERTETIYKNELSLVCDQRYTEDHMNRMVEVIRAFRQEE